MDEFPQELAKKVYEVAIDLTKDMKDKSDKGGEKRYNWEEYYKIGLGDNLNKIQTKLKDQKPPFNDIKYFYKKIYEKNNTLLLFIGRIKANNRPLWDLSLKPHEDRYQNNLQYLQNKLDQVTKKPN